MADISKIATVRELTYTGEARRIRERARVSISELAKAANLYPSTVSRYERQLRTPQGEEGERYLAVLLSLAALRRR
jgi:transcriptional regulator with XRE-family HTH domain